MKTFYSQLSDGSTMLKQADKMEIVDNSLRVYCGNCLVAFIDLGTVLYAHIR